MTVATETDSGFLKYCDSFLITVLGSFVETELRKM